MSSPDPVRALMGEFIEWYSGHREGSPNATYARFDRFVREVASALAAPPVPPEQVDSQPDNLLAKMQDMLFRVEWVRQSGGSAFACPFCRGVSERNDGPGHTEDCEWVAISHLDCRQVPVAHEIALTRAIQGNALAAMNIARDAADQIARLKAQLSAVDALGDVLDDVESYLDDRQDVNDGDDGQPVPNKAMSLLRALRVARNEEILRSYLSAPPVPQAAPETADGNSPLEEAREIARIAMDFHRNIEGEYSCPGVTCPGVQRLIQKFTALDGVGVADWVKQANSQPSASPVPAETEPPPPSENEALLDQMMAEALPTNHPAMLEYVRQRMELKRLRVQASAPTVAAPPAETGLTFAEVAEASLSRAVRWHPGGIADWSALEWAGAMAGEAGEACNAAKKLKRVEDQIANINHEAGRSLTDIDTARRHVAREVADTMLYGFCLAARVGIDIAPVLIDVFNRKSEEYGFPERVGLPASPAETGVSLIAAERQRQMAVEGWTPEHDDEHKQEELLMAAYAYIAKAWSGPTVDMIVPPACWPWSRSWWKPSPDKTRNLVKAGALIAAEIDRLNRLPTSPAETGKG